jgi:hypothetical protein
VSDNDKSPIEGASKTLVLNPEPAAGHDPMQAAEARMRRALGLDGEHLRARPAQERNEPTSRTPERSLASGHKRRFVHDGEVPVTLVHGLPVGRREHSDTSGSRNSPGQQPTNRLEVAEAALAAEIATRERIERALQESQAMVRDLRTKLGHAELARQEAVEMLARERGAATDLRLALRVAEEAAATDRSTREEAEKTAVELRREVAPEADQPSDAAAVAPRIRKTRSRLDTAQEEAAPKQRDGASRGRAKEVQVTREPKPIRWWAAPRGRKKP